MTLDVYPNMHQGFFIYCVDNFISSYYNIFISCEIVKWLVGNFMKSFLCYSVRVYLKDYIVTHDPDPIYKNEKGFFDIEEALKERDVYMKVYENREGFERCELVINNIIEDSRKLIDVIKEIHG